MRSLGVAATRLEHLGTGGGMSDSASRGWARDVHTVIRSQGPAAWQPTQASIHESEDQLAKRPRDTTVLPLATPDVLDTII